LKPGVRVIENLPFATTEIAKHSWRSLGAMQRRKYLSASDLR
jgi:hypothetical protein